MSKPRYIYSAGNTLCTATISFPDRLHPHRDDAKCFVKHLGQVEALAYSSYANLLYFADLDRAVIYRTQMENENQHEVVVTGTGKVRG